jgi:cytochrome P450 family 20 subfamily A
MIRDEFITMFFGGFHTTSSLLSFAFNQIGRRPDIQAKLQEEIDRVVEGDFVTMSEMRKLKYTRNILHEILRYYTITFYLLRVDHDSATKFHDGNEIPAGTSMILALGKVLKDPNYWTNPDEFNPDRFNAPESKKPLVFSPFGFAGGRTCPGK